MSDLERRGASRPSRRQREQRAYRLVVASGGFGLLAVAALVLAILTPVSGAWFVLFAVLTVVCSLMLRRTLKP
jgi:hypothetical protein